MSSERRNIVDVPGGKLTEHLQGIREAYKSRVTIERRFELTDINRATKIVFNYINIEGNKDGATKADFIFILGGDREEVIATAHDLWVKGDKKAKFVFYSWGGVFGGSNKFGMLESEFYKKQLLKLGVPEGSIWTETEKENMTSNTYMEAKKLTKFLTQRLLNDEGFTNLDTAPEAIKEKVKERIKNSTVAQVKRPEHARRALATFEQQNPDIKFIPVTANRAVYYSDPDLQLRLVQEIERLITYGVWKDDIKMQGIPSEVLEAAALLRRNSKISHQYKTQDRVKAKEDTKKQTGKTFEEMYRQLQRVNLS